MAQSLTVEKRDERGKNAVGRLRRAGLVPAVLYGEQKESLTIKVLTKELELLLGEHGGDNAIFDLTMKGSDLRRPVMIKELQRHPISGEIEHCDFIRISMDKPVIVDVPVELVGVPIGVKDFGGLLGFVRRELSVECLPGNIPESIVLDVSKMGLGDSLRVSDVVVPESVQLLDEPKRVIVNVAAPSVEKEVSVEGEEAVSAEAAAEPEVIKKGKEADEGGKAAG